MVNTVNSILNQTYEDYEIIIKDGLSTDASLETLKEAEVMKTHLNNGKIQIISRKDQNVYDGMNQALDYCSGEYILFLNCGDLFCSEDVLEKVAQEIQNYSQPDNAIFYGNTYCNRTQVVVHSANKITGFTCYRNIPCHQSCFYSRDLFLQKKYDTRLKIRADYDHFLWCFYEKKTQFYYMDILIADYEGGGISESKENQKTDRDEHEAVIRRYMRRAEIIKYKLIMMLTLAPIRRRMAESEAFSQIYHKIKCKIYR